MNFLAVIKFGDENMSRTRILICHLLLRNIFSAVSAVGHRNEIIHNGERTKFLGRLTFSKTVVRLLSAIAQDLIWAKLDHDKILNYCF